jgi:hypothetical protein
MSSWLRAVFREMARPREGENHKAARGRAAEVLRLSDRQARALIYPEPNYGVELDPAVVEEAWTRWLHEEWERAMARLAWIDRQLAECPTMSAHLQAERDAVAREARIARVERELRGIARERAALFEQANSGVADGGVEGAGDGDAGVRRGLRDLGGGGAVSAGPPAQPRRGQAARSAGPARAAAGGRR